MDMQLILGADSRHRNAFAERRQTRRLAQRTWPVVFFDQRVCASACARSVGTCCVTRMPRGSANRARRFRAAQDILGQSDLETTLRVYTHAVPDSKRPAMANVAALLFPSVLSQGAEQKERWGLVS